RDAGLALAGAGPADGDRGPRGALARRVVGRVEPEADRLVEDAGHRQARAELGPAGRGRELHLEGPGAVSPRSIDQGDRDRLARPRVEAHRAGERTAEVRVVDRTARRGDLPRRADAHPRAAGPS